MNREDYPQPINKEGISLAEAAKKLGCNKRSLRHLITYKDLPCIRYFKAGGEEEIRLLPRNLKWIKKVSRGIDGTQIDGLSDGVSSTWNARRRKNNGAN